MKPNNNDPLRVRRTCMLMAGAWSIFIFPMIVLNYVTFLDAPVEIGKALLTYVIGLAATPIVAYFIGAHKNGNKEQ
jgi:uncharacterized membrane protein YczE